MSFQNFGTLGAVGETLALLGVAILWTFRSQAFEWLREFFQIWRGHVSASELHVSDPLYRRQRPRRPRGALILVGALALVFLGQMLFLLDLTF